MRELLLVALTLGLAGDAAAFVRSRASSGMPTAWRSNCVIVQPDLAGSIDLPATITTPAIQRSLAVWRTSSASCSFLSLNFAAPATLDAHLDGVNTIKFRSDKWCHPDDAQFKDTCYDANAAGITTIFYADHPGKDDDGTMLDADIELNEINFTFDLIDPVSGPTRMARAGTDIADLENTLVHEFGHLQGLDHTCIFKASAATAKEVDGNGVPPPNCAKLGELSPEAQATILEATMFASAAPAETSKRTPEPDDIAGICSSYPIAMDPKVCEPADVSAYIGKGCAFGTVSVRHAHIRGAALLAALLCLAAFAMGSRISRRSRRPQSPDTDPTAED